MDVARRRGEAAPRHGVAGLVPAGTAVGTVLRAEVETTLDGTTVTALLAPKGKSEPKPIERIEIIGHPPEGPRRQRGAGRQGQAAARRLRRRRSRRLPSPVRPWPAYRGWPPRGATAPRDAERRAGAATAQARPGGSTAGCRTESRWRRRRTARPVPAVATVRRTVERGDRRPATSTVYRNAALAELRPEQIPVAEQLIKGGIPSVRQAIQEQNTRARAEGRPEVTEAPLMAMAEELRPIINLATWKDRASVARNTGKDTPLRELRSIVASASTVTLDDEGTEMLTVAADQSDRAGHRPPRALGRAHHHVPRRGPGGRRRACLDPPARSRPPASRPNWPCACRTPPGRPCRPTSPPADWLALLEVVVECPVRRTVKPAGTTHRRRRGPAGRGPQGRRARCPSWPACSGSRSLRRPAPVGPCRPARPVGRSTRLVTTPLTVRPSGCVGRPSVQGSVHHQQAGLEAGRLEELLASRSPGNADAVDAGAALGTEPRPAACSSSRWPRPTSRAPGSTKQTSRTPRRSPAVPLRRPAQGHTGHPVVQGADQGRPARDRRGRRPRRHRGARGGAPTVGRAGQRRAPRRPARPA